MSELLGVGILASEFLASELLVSELWVSELLVSELWVSELLGVGTSGVGTLGVGTSGVGTLGVGTVASPGFLFDLEVVGTAVLLVFSSTWRWSELRCSWFSLRPGGGRDCGAPGFLFDLEVVGTAVLLVFSSTWRWSELLLLNTAKMAKTLQIVSELCVEGNAAGSSWVSGCADGIAEGQRLNFGIGVISLLKNGGSNFNSNVRQMGNFSTEFSE